MRSSQSQSSRTTVFARARQIELGKPWSFDVAEPSFTGGEQMLDYANPKHQEMMSLEGLKNWERGRASGFSALAEAVEELDS